MADELREVKGETRQPIGAGLAARWRAADRPRAAHKKKTRGPGRLGCGPPRLLRLHRDTEGGAADVRRHGESSRAGPSVIGKLVCHVKTSPAHDSKRAGCSLLGPGDNAEELPRPGQTGPLLGPGPLPRRKAPGILKYSILVFENPQPEKRSATTDPNQQSCN
jgi:hypothetical protein